MSFLTDMLTGNEQRDCQELQDSDYNKDFLSGSDGLGCGTVAGTCVNEVTAQSLTAVYAAVGIISSTIASLPLKVYEQLQPRGKEPALDNPLYELLHNSPNPVQTSYEWRELTSIHELLWGAGLSEIEFDASGQPVALWPIPPWLVQVRNIKNGSITTQGVDLPKDATVVYEITLPRGGKRFVLPEHMLVFRRFAMSMYGWKSPIAVHRETLGAAMAVKEFGARTFGQGTNPAGIVTHPGKMSENAEKSVRNDLTQYKGLSRSHLVMLLEQGMTWQRVGLPPEDAQYLETRRFDISEIARIYNVPLYMLADHEKQTSWGKGLEEQKDGFVNFTLRPYLVKWEQQLIKKLFFDSTFFPEFLIAGLLRGNLKDRYAAYVQGRQGGWLSANEVRAFENMNPLPGDQGDIYMVPLNMQSAEDVGEDDTENEE
jgi:HK97 family phage portal protein